MMLIRRATMADLDSLHQVAVNCGIGMTSLPDDIELLSKKLENAERSFKNAPEKQDNGYYLFVMVDPQTDKVVGTTGIKSFVGGNTPFYNYKITNRTRVSHELKIRAHYQILNLVNDHEGKTEIGSLYLEPEYRKNGNGLLLSKSRFLFMADFPQLFADVVIAEMRGYFDAHGESPFWNNVGTHFFKMSFEQADLLTSSTNKQYIIDLMPYNPIYVELLPKEAQAVIGKPHDSTLAALKILLKEGFEYRNYIDIFDAGPLIECRLANIQTAKTSQVMRVERILDEVSSHTYLLSNISYDFRATKSSVIFNEKENRCIICKQTAELLKLKIGDQLRIAPISLSKKHSYLT